MEQLQNGFTLDIPAGCFPLSTDSILLSDFVHIPKNARILDLGSGCGTLGLLLCAKDSGCAVTGVEIDGGAHDAALTNIARNGLQYRMTSLHGDLRQAQGKVFDLCISNPPYYSGGPASLTTPTARRDDHCSTSQPYHAHSPAGRSLLYGGTFCRRGPSYQIWRRLLSGTQAGEFGPALLFGCSKRPGTQAAAAGPSQRGRPGQPGTARLPQGRKTRSDDR